MSTTTIRLSDGLKARVARAAKRAGTTPHGFILEAIAEKTERQDRLDDFHDSADRRHAEIAASGMTVPWGEMRDYLRRRIDGSPAPHPKPRKLSRKA